MLRDELIKKMKASHARIATLEGDDLKREQSVFAELKGEMERLDTIIRTEAQTSHDREMHDAGLWEAFGKLVRGEEVDGVARSALAVREPGLRDSSGPAGFRVPGDARIWFSEPPVRRVALGSVSSDIADLLPCPPLAPLFSLPTPPTPMFDRSTKLAAVNGVAIPFLEQTAANPYASVTVTCGVGEGEDKPESGIPTVSKCTIVTEECSGSTIISDKALRRAPNYEGIVARMMRGALAWQLERNIIAALNADATVIGVPRAAVDAVGWTDLVDLEGAIPYFWAISGEYAMHQDAQTHLKRTLGAVAPGYPMYNPTTAAPMYTILNGRPFFLDSMSALGVVGDVYYGDYANVFLGIGQDVAFRRSNEGATLMKANSTMFAVFADIGICIPVGAAFARLTDLGGSPSGSLSPSPSP